jgi:hypothetical protein
VLIAFENIAPLSISDYHIILTGTKIDKAAKRAEERRKIEEEEKLLKWGKVEENRREEELRNKPLAM